MVYWPQGLNSSASDQALTHPGKPGFQSGFPNASNTSLTGTRPFLLTMPARIKAEEWIFPFRIVC